MLQALDAVRLHSETANIYTGRDVLLPEREELRSLEPTADGSQEARLRLAVGDDELRLGNNAQAIEHLKASHELSDRADSEAAFRLAVAYMRMAEAQNCLAHADPEAAFCQSAKVASIVIRAIPRRPSGFSEPSWRGAPATSKRAGS